MAYRDSILLHQKYPAVSHNQLSYCLKRRKKKLQETRGSAKLRSILSKSKKARLRKPTGSANQSAANLSRALRAVEEIEDEVASEQSEEAMSTGSAGSAHMKPGLITDFLHDLNNQPILRSRSVLDWLNTNTLIDDIDKVAVSKTAVTSNVVTDNRPASTDGSISEEEVPRKPIPELQSCEAASGSHGVNPASEGFVNNEINNESSENKVCSSNTHDHTSDYNSQSTSCLNVSSNSPTVIAKESATKESQDTKHDCVLKSFDKFVTEQKEIGRNPKAHRAMTQRDKEYYKRLEPFTPTFPKILALLYLACRVNGEEILLLDILK